VGGLPPGVAAGQLQQRFQPFGQATVHVLPPKEGSADGESKRSFCYVDLQPKDASSLHRCLSAVSSAAATLTLKCMQEERLIGKTLPASQHLVSQYNHSKWLGHVLRVEVAKPDYLTRLQAEWEEDARTGGFRPQRRAGKRKRGPEEDGEEEWNGIPVPLDTSKPITFTVGPRRRNKKPKVDTIGNGYSEGGQDMSTQVMQPGFKMGAYGLYVSIQLPTLCFQHDICPWQVCCLGSSTLVSPAIPLWCCVFCDAPLTGA
jgi:hypothetical protein